jgi:hypothetical protein
MTAQSKAFLEAKIHKARESIFNNAARAQSTMNRNAPAGERFGDQVGGAPSKHCGPDCKMRSRRAGAAPHSTNGPIP